jgi:uncharacterized protein YndB with AHSA1/START domain
VTPEAVRARVEIRAPARVVFSMFTEADLLARWIGIAADLEPRSGGRFRFELLPGEFCSGRFTEVVPHRRIAFTWGWESGALPVAPGSTTVEVDLEERGDITVVRLTHHGLDAAMRSMHEDGWRRYLTRLSAVCEGRAAGEDPAAAYEGDPARLRRRHEQITERST